MMEKIVSKTKNSKGGRPKKAIKKDQTITVKCSHIDKTLITSNAKKMGMSLSEFLRETGLNRKIDSKIKVLPKQVLEMRARLNQMAANLNQVAKKKNMGEPFNALERAEASEICQLVKKVAQEMVDYLRNGNDKNEL